MGTSIHRILVMTIILDLMLIMIGAYYVDTAFSDNELITYSSNLEDFQSNYSSNFESTNPDTETTILERTYGDQKYGGQMWWTLFKKGITVPKACRGIDESNCPQIETYLMRGYSYAFIIINILLLLEIFLILYTKKNN